MKIRQIFPLGKAYGAAFCNRTEETKRLVSHIESGKHTFLLAPRRYGKSSLCERAFGQLSFSHATVDFYVAVTEKDAEHLMLKGINELINKTMGKASEKMMLLAKKYAKRIEPKLTMGNDSMRLELSLSAESNPAENIADALLVLEKLLKEKNQQAALLLDEFQEIGNMEAGRGIEGAIRSIAQETQHISIIFCGSNSHLLKAMFEDERRPLYKLCRKITLGRISSEHYQQHLAKASRKIWGTPFQTEVFEKIMELTERHPYYVNYLCDVLCSEYELTPKEKDVERAWTIVMEEERSDLYKDFSALTANQRKLMIYIAHNGSDKLFSSEAAKNIGIAQSSIPRAAESLIEKNYLTKGENGYRLIVPVYRTLLNRAIT